MTTIIDGTNGSTFPATISVGNATPSSSGAGITFPATQSASTDANTLDDYEEGTFTPTVAGSSTAGTTTYGEQLGFYTKIGRQVTIQIFVGISNMTGTGGAIEFGGFPFASNATAGRCTGTAMTDSLTYPTANSSAVFYVTAGGNYGRIFVCASNTAWAVVAPDTAFTAYITATYFV